MASETGGHSRHNSGDSTKRVDRSAKHRYVFIHGNKQDKKRLRNDLNYPKLPYPKGDSKKYDSGGTVRKQNLLFT